MPIGVCPFNAARGSRSPGSRYPHFGTARTTSCGCERERRPVLGVTPLKRNASVQQVGHLTQGGVFQPEQRNGVLGSNRRSPRAFRETGSGRSTSRRPSPRQRPENRCVTVGTARAHAAIPISHRGCASLSSARYPAGAPLLDLRIEPAHKQAERRPFREQHRGSVSAPSRATSPAIEKRNRAGYSSTGRDRPSTPTRAALWSRLDGSPRTGLLRLRRRPTF